METQLRTLGVVCAAVFVLVATAPMTVAQELPPGKGDGAPPPPWDSAGIGNGGSNACSTAEAIRTCNELFAFDNSNATTDGNPHAACESFGQQQIDNDVWFCWTAAFSGDTVTLDTCDLTGVDTKVAVYGPYADCGVAVAACAPTDTPLLDCNDDTCGLQSSVTFSTPSAGDAYLFRIGTFPGASGGTGDFRLTCTVPVELESLSIE